MKRLFLTSSAYQVLDFVPELFQLNPKSTTVAFIPTASNVYPQKPWVELDHQKLLMMGFQVQIVDLEIIHGKELEQILTSVDIIFVSGGNTFYLLDQASKSGFVDLIPNLIEQKIYIGSSAGSVLACPDIGYVDAADDATIVSLSDYKGLHLIDEYLLVHWNAPKFAPTLKEMEAATAERKTICITDSQALAIQGNKYELLQR